MNTNRLLLGIVIFFLSSCSSLDFHRVTDPPLSVFMLQASEQKKTAKEVKKEIYSLNKKYIYLLPTYTPITEARDYQELFSIHFYNELTKIGNQKTFFSSYHNDTKYSDLSKDITSFQDFIYEIGIVEKNALNKFATKLKYDQTSDYNQFLNVQIDGWPELEYPFITMQIRLISNNGVEIWHGGVKEKVEPFATSGEQIDQLIQKVAKYVAEDIFADLK